MENIGIKTDSTPGSSGQEISAEFNDHNVEIQGVIGYSGQTLNQAIVNQLAKALWINGAGAISVQENSPAANSAALTPWTGSGGLQVPDAYSEMHGAIISFQHTIANTASSLTSFTVN